LFADFFRAFYIDNQAGDGKGKRIPAGGFCRIKIVLEKNVFSFGNTLKRRKSI
jgi:hypothetical protein